MANDTLRNIRSDLAAGVRQRAEARAAGTPMVGVVPVAPVPSSVPSTTAQHRELMRAGPKPPQREPDREPRTLGRPIVKHAYLGQADFAQAQWDAFTAAQARGEQPNWQPSLPAAPTTAAHVRGALGHGVRQVRDYHHGVAAPAAPAPPQAGEAGARLALAVAFGLDPQEFAHVPLDGLRDALVRSAPRLHEAAQTEAEELATLGGGASAHQVDTWKLLRAPAPARQTGRVQLTDAERTDLSAHQYDVAARLSEVVGTSISPAVLGLGPAHLSDLAATARSVRDGVANAADAAAEAVDGVPTNPGHPSVLRGLLGSRASRERVFDHLQDRERPAGVTTGERRFVTPNGEYLDAEAAARPRPEQTPTGAYWASKAPGR